jgi:hypothetical protein
VEPSSGLRVDDLGLLLEAVRHGYGGLRASTSPKNCWPGARS